MPPLPIEGRIADRRGEFSKLTRAARTEPGDVRAFVASKLALLRSHPEISQAEREEAEATLARAFGPRSREALDKETGPVPGGVGYGMFYTNAFRTAFARGTSFYYEIVCPHQPAGNVTTWLYLTATNRSQKGVEAFVSYNGQNETRFKVFDWARSDNWQTNISFANLGDYLRGIVSHGWGLQALLVWNRTVEIGSNRWRNEVLLHNRAANRWDLTYRYDYDSTTAEQTSGFVGSWGPIVETFQSSYAESAVDRFRQHHVDHAQRGRPVGELGGAHRQPEHDPQRRSGLLAAVPRCELLVRGEKLEHSSRRSSRWPRNLRHRPTVPSPIAGPSSSA